MKDRIYLSKEQVKSFESPVRASLINALRARGALSVRELSQILGVRPDRLYYHLKQLSALGLIQIQQMRAAETKPEAVYELTAREFYMDNEALDPDYAWSVFRSSKNIHKLALSRYESALKRDGVAADIRFSFASGRMSKENLEKLKADLRELGRRVLASSDPEGQPVLLTGLIVPSNDAAD